MSEPTDKELAEAILGAANFLDGRWTEGATVRLLRLAAQRLTAPLPDEVTDAIERSARDAKMVRECNAALGKRIAELEEEARNQAHELGAVLRRNSQRVSELEAECREWRDKATGYHEDTGF